jgi:hypothetical protein
MTHGREPRAGPDTGRLAKGPRALMEDGAYLLPFLSLQDRLDRDRHGRPTLYAREATRVERVQHVADRWWRTA